MSESPLTVLYRDEHLIAVDKPPGLLVHRTRLDQEREAVAVQRLRDQIGQRVWPVHRLDKPTSGVLLFALSAEAASRMQPLFAADGVDKRYLAVVRGWAAEAGRVERPVKMRDGGPRRLGVTDYRRLATVELPIPVGPYPAARYSLLELCPRTGRRHQLRYHCEHLGHPIIGDTSYGRGEHNRLFREHLDCHRLLLMAVELRFIHPCSGQPLCIQAKPEQELARLFQRFGWGAHWPA
ncbi:pseudouridine synthase [Alkalilimnicola sp. S0819]|uniref:pseudouridine synthase n=1 Tax=Alkalilimnicola sp. S0819 TaxID=2613922 RepID=UPI0012614F82|nr:pseudouridine synthase [Alkalilimnicola sp. S0819]KAB7628319.1 pseudouridylate synthase [Alkalilimnicola sp. S0819]MPQ15217.1 pseudouridylate synthase [Alkalilimnicola sp. S0819]